MANLVGSLAVLLSTLFGGFLLSRKQMPPVIGWLARLSFVRCGPRPVSHDAPQLCCDMVLGRSRQSLVTPPVI